MTISSSFRNVLGCFLVVLFGASAVRAESGGLRDNAGFFSDQAKTEASRNIAEIGKRFKKDLVIETYNSLPAEFSKGADTADKAALNRVFEQWAIKQARDERVNGVYVLLTKEPAHLHVLVGNETQKRAFTLKDRDTLVSSMLAKLKNKQNDEALLEAVNFVSLTLKAHAAVRPSAAAPVRNEAHAENSTSWGWVWPAIIGLILAWVVVAVFRAMFSGGGAVGGGMGSGMGGGGFFSSLLGGMFGAAAGMWLYDAFSGHHGSAFAADANDRGDSESAFGGKDSDYSGSGDSFGDNSSGGGDFGGDSGGGDFGGGGDSGGGGDF